MPNEELILDEQKKQQLDSNIKNMLSNGATQEDVMSYASDFKTKYGQKKSLIGNTTSKTLENGVSDTPKVEDFASQAGGWSGGNKEQAQPQTKPQELKTPAYGGMKEKIQVVDNSKDMTSSEMNEVDKNIQKTLMRGQGLVVDDNAVIPDTYTVDSDVQSFLSGIETDKKEEVGKYLYNLKIGNKGEFTKLYDKYLQGELTENDKFKIESRAINNKLQTLGNDANIYNKRNDIELANNSIKEYNDLINVQKEIIKKYPDVYNKEQAVINNQAAFDALKEINPITGGIAEGLNNLRNVPAKLFVDAPATMAKFFNDKLEEMQGLDANAYSGADKAYDAIREFTDDYLKIPQTQKPLFNDKGNLDYQQVIPKTVQTLGDMAALMIMGGRLGAIGEGAVLAKGTADAIGLTVAGYLSQVTDYYDSAKELDLSDTDARQYAENGAFANAMLENVNPNLKFLRNTNAIPTAIEELIKQGIKPTAGEIAKKILTEVGQENAQELLQSLSDLMAGVAANQQAGKQLFDSQLSPENIKETVILTTLVTALAGGANISMENLQRKESKYALMQYFKNKPTEVLDAINTQVQNGSITQAQADKLQIDLTKQTITQSKTPTNLSDEQKIEVQPLLEQKQELVKEQEKVDDAFKGSFKEQIEVIDNKINEIAKPKLEEIKLEETKPEAPKQEVISEEDYDGLIVMRNIGILEEGEAEKIKAYEDSLDKNLQVNTTDNGKEKGQEEDVLSTQTPIQEDIATEPVSSDVMSETPTELRDVESTAKALAKIGITSKIPASSEYKRTEPKEVSEAYHKAKADGSNPELVNAVESLLSKEQTPKSENKKVDVVGSGVVDNKTKQQLLDERLDKIKEIKDKAEGTREERTKRYKELVNELGDETAALKKLQEEINARAKKEIDKLPELPKTESEVINEKGENDFKKIKKDLGFKSNDYSWGKSPMDEDMGDMLLSKDKESVIFIKPNEVEVYDEKNDQTDTITNGVKIELVSTKESSRGKGKAKEMVQKVTDWADKNNTDLHLDIAPQDKSTTEAGLKKLYESFGFEFDGIHGIRKPKAVEQSIENKSIPKSLNEIKSGIFAYGKDNSKTTKRIQYLGANESTLPKQDAQELQRLRGERDSYISELDKQLQSISDRYGEQTDPETFNREDRQQWGLLQRELQVVGQSRTKLEQENYSKSRVQGGNGNNAVSATNNGDKTQEIKGKDIRAEYDSRGGSSETTNELREKDKSEQSLPTQEVKVEGDALKNVEYSLMRPKTNVLVYVSPEKLLEQAAKDNPDFDVTNKKNQIGNRVQKAKDFINNYIKDNRWINPKTRERGNTKVKFEPSQVSVNDGKIGFEDGRHRVLAAKEMGLTSVGIEVPKEQEQYFKSKFSNVKVEQNKKELSNTSDKKDMKEERVEKVGSETYRNTKHKEGRTKTKTIADGTQIKGTYKIVSSDDVLASHNEETFSKTKGFPTDEKGNTVNDRNYETDINAQSEVGIIAENLDDRAISQTPIVTKDGIIVDGNNRTMSRKLAAKNGTDANYIQALKENADLYGFTEEDVDAVKNPMLVFEAKEDLPYTTKTFSRFNKEEKKAKSPREKAVEISKTISDRARRIIAEIYENAETPSDVTSDPKKVSELKKIFIDEGIIQTNELPKYFNLETGTATRDGVSFIETILMGSALDENTIRTLDMDGMGNVRNIILKSVVSLTKNAALKEDSLQPNILKGIELVSKAKASKTSVLSLIGQLQIYEISNYSSEDLAIAILLEGKGFNDFLKIYNSEVGTESLFYGKMTKDKLIDNLLNQKIKNYEQVRKNLRNDAEQGKGEVQDGNGNIGQEDKGSEANKGEKENKIEDEGSVDREKGVPFIKKIFDKIRSITKLNKVQHNRLFDIDTKLSKEIADAYEKMKHNPNNPKVKKAYKAMVEETKQQYDALIEGGLKAERWTGKGEPYANSKEMLSDLKENNHLWFLPNESAFGDKDAATKYKDNIGLQDSGITIDGKPLTNSEVFRIVHDAVHGINGSEFGAIGEENATLQHLSMYSDEALPAVVAQTRGQNSWVNFSGVNDSANAKFKEAAKLEKEGKYDEAKKIREEAQKEFTFAEPKIGLLPNKYNFRYYGTKNAELASKERTNTRSGDGNKGESKPLPTLGYGKNVARESKSFSSRSNSEGRTIRTSYGDIVPKAIHTVKQSLVDGIKKAFPKATIDKELFEVDADIFHKAATKAKSVNEFGAAVDVLSPKEYSKYRLFITEDGLTGIALSPNGDLGSGFDMSGKPRRLPQLLVLGIENGATHANAFHTILPNYYTAFGFKPVARNLWNDALKPEDWNYETFKDFNNGRPDVVHFIWDGGDRNTIHERIGQFDNYNDYHKEQTPVINTWKEAQEIVQQSLKETPTSEKQNKISDAANKLADDFAKKFKSSPPPKFYDKDGNEMQIFTKGATWNDMVDAIAEGIRQAGKVAQGAVDIAKVISEYLESQKWFQDLTDANKKIITERVKSKFLEEKSKEIKPPVEPPTENKKELDSEELLPDDKAFLKRVATSTNISKEAKDILEKEGLKYVPRSWDEAKKIAQELKKEFTERELLSMIDNGKFNNDIGTFIMAEMMNDSLLLEEKADTPEARLKAAEKSARLYIKADEIFRGWGRGINAIRAFYRDSPLGVVLKTKKQWEERVDNALKGQEKTIKELLDDIKDSDEFRDFLNEEVNKKLKNKKPIINKARHKKIIDFFDSLKSTKADPNKPQASSIIPPQILDNAIEFMKQATLAGSSVNDIIRYGIEHINSNIKEAWDENEFRKKFEPKIQQLIDSLEENDWNSVMQSLKTKNKQAKVSVTTKYTNLLNNIKKLSSNERASMVRGLIGNLYSDKIITKEQLSDYVNNEIDLQDIIESLDDTNKELVISKLNQLSTTIVSAKEGAKGDVNVTDILRQRKEMLDRWRTKLDKLEPQKRDDFLRKIMNKVIEAGGLEYDDFRQMYAEAIGLPVMTDEIAAKIKELVLNKNKFVESFNKAKELLEKDKLTDAEYESFKKEAELAEKVAEKSAKELNLLVGKTGNVSDLIGTLMQGSALSLRSTVNNVLFNAVNMPIKMASSITRTGIEQLVFRGLPTLIPKLKGKEFFKRNPYNAFSGGVSATEYAGIGLKKSLKQIYTGAGEKDYFNHEIRAGLQPKEALSKIWKNITGARKDSINDNIYHAIEGTMGWLPETMFRLQNVGDKPIRFYAEAKEAARIANEKGLTGNKAKLFVQFPDEQSKERIQKAGDESVLTQENKINEWVKDFQNYLTRQSEKENSKLGKFAFNLVKVFAKSTMLFTKTPANAAMMVMKLAVPEASAITGLAQISRSIKTNDKSLFDDGMKNLSIASVGWGLAYLTANLIATGLITPPPDDEDKKSKRGFYETGYKLNWSAFNRWMDGGNINPMKGDVVTDMSILGTLGYVMSATWARSKQSKNYLDGAFNAFGTSFNASVEQAILRNAGAAATAIKNHSVSDLLISYLTSLENIISPRGLFDLVEYNSYVPDKTLLTDKEKVLAPLKMRFFGGDKKNIPPTIDMFGEEVKRYGDSDSWVASYFLGTRTLQIDPAKEKLAKMYLELETNKDLQKGVYPTKPEPSITINGKKVELTKDEYLEYQKMIGKSRFDWIKYTFDGASIEDEDKNTMVFEDLNEAQKIDAIKDSYSKGYNQGVKNFIEVNPKFEEANFEDETNRVSIQGKPD